MNDEALISHIEELGLSNKEARVYVACLKLGPSPVQRIADQSGIKRVTTYVILESLVGLGLVSQSIKGKKTYFVAEEPTNLKRLIDKRVHELKEQQQSFEHILPQLQGLKTVPKELPEVKFYDGKDGVQSLFATFFAQHKGSAHELYGFSNVDQLHVFFPERAFGRPNPDRIKYNVKGYLLYTSKQGPVYKGTDEVGNRVSRFVPHEQYPFKGDISVFGDYVIMISFEEDRPIGVTVRNAELARGMKAIFDISWDHAAQFNQ